MLVVFLVVIGDILIGDPPEYHGLIRELTGITGGLAASRPLVLGTLCALVLLPLGSMRSMDRLAAVNIIGVGSNGVFAVLMVVLLAASTRCGQARVPPLWPQWGALVEGRGGAFGAAMCLASTVPVILNCFTCHQVGGGPKGDTWGTLFWVCKGNFKVASPQGRLSWGGGRQRCRHCGRSGGLLVQGRGRVGGGDVPRVHRAGDFGLLHVTWWVGGWGVMGSRHRVYVCSSVKGKSEACLPGCRLGNSHQTRRVRESGVCAWCVQSCRSAARALSAA